MCRRNQGKAGIVCWGQHRREMLGGPARRRCCVVGGFRVPARRVARCKWGIIATEPGVRGGELRGGGGRYADASGHSGSMV
jgi:hypothetical protein